LEELKAKNTLNLDDYDQALKQIQQLQETNK